MPSPSVTFASGAGSVVASASATSSVFTFGMKNQPPSPSVPPPGVTFASSASSVVASASAAPSVFPFGMENQLPDTLKFALPSKKRNQDYKDDDKECSVQHSKRSRRNY
jgi:hypothetical protein